MGAPIFQNISLPFLLLLKLTDKLTDLFPFFTRLSNFCLILKCKAETYLKPERGQGKMQDWPKIHIYAAADFQAQKVKAWKVWAELEQIFSSSTVRVVFKRKLLALWTKEFSSPSSQVRLLLMIRGCVCLINLIKYCAWSSSLKQQLWWAFLTSAPDFATFTFVPFLSTLLIGWDTELF